MPPTKEHGCEWQEYAKKLEERLAKLEEAVRSRRGHRSEKRPKTAKMPPPIAPAPAEPTPRAEDDLRHAKLEIEPQRKLSYTWAVGDMELDTVVTFTLTPTASGTRLSLVQSGFRLDQKQNSGGARYGWKMMGGKLVDLLGRLA